MNIVIADCRADNRTIYSLENAGLQVIPTIRLDCLYDAIASHADIQIHYIGNNSFVCALEAYNHYKRLLPDGFALIKGSKSLDAKYPADIAYNAAALKDYVICNSAYTAIEILETYKSMGKDILNVKQGYSKCSVCMVNGSAIITADKRIAKTAKDHNIDVLEINSGYIKLRSMDYGFIGGATGLIKKNTLAVNGELNSHPQGKRIKDFCIKHNSEIVELKDGIMEDIGSIIANIDI